MKKKVKIIERNNEIKRTLGKRKTEKKIIIMK